MFWQVAAWIFVPYFLFVRPVVKFVRNEKENKRIARDGEATRQWIHEYMDISSTGKSTELLDSFIAQKDDFVREIEEDLSFIFGNDNTQPDWEKDDPPQEFYLSTNGDYTFRHPWQIVFHIYCARAGVIVWRHYGLWDTYTGGIEYTWRPKCRRFRAPNRLIISKDQTYRSCAVIEKYLSHCYGNKYLLYYDECIPTDLKWDCEYGKHGARPW